MMTHHELVRRRRQIQRRIREVLAQRRSTAPVVVRPGPSDPPDEPPAPA